MRIPLRATLPVALLAAGLALLPRPSAGQTNGFVLHCLSARAAGLGCVTRGQEGIPTTLFHDPAGIVSFDRPAFEMNLSAFVPKLAFQNASNAGADGSVHAYPMGSIAYVGKKLGRLSWAVGMDPIGGLGSDFRLTNPVLGANQNYESFFMAAKMGPVVAYELAPGFSIGGSVSLVYSQIRQFRMPFSMPSSAAAGMAGLAQLDLAHYPGMFAQMTELTAYGDSKSFTGTAVTGDLGVSWKASPKLRMSASWSPKTLIGLSGGSASMDMGAQFNAMYGAMVQERMVNHGQSQTAATATVAQLLGAAGLDLSKGVVGTYDAGIDLSLPQTIGAGATYRPAAGWLLAFEGGWMGWGRAEHDMPFKLTNGNNTNLNLLINGNATNASFTYPFPLRWKDSWIGKAGVEKTVGDGAVRLGWAYGSNPVPDNALFITFPAIVEHSAIVGGTIKVGGMPLDIAFVHAFNRTMTAAPTSLVGSEYRNSVTDLQENVLTVGTVVHF